MKALVMLAFLFVAAGGVYYVASQSKSLGDFFKSKQIQRSAWRVKPHTNSSGIRCIYLSCSGEEDFIFWDEALFLTEHGKPGQKRATENQWEMALLDAEVQVNEFNRLRQQGLKELKR